MAGNEGHTSKGSVAQKTASARKAIIFICNRLRVDKIPARPVIDVPMANKGRKKRGKNHGIQRPYEPIGPLQKQIAEAQKLYFGSRDTFRRLEAMRQAVVSKTKIVQIAKYTGCSPSSICRYLLLLSEPDGIEQLCALPQRKGYRLATVKITPDIGKALKSEINKKRLRSTRDIIAWLNSVYGVKMKRTGIYSWLRRNDKKLRTKYPATRAKEASSNGKRMRFDPHFGWLAE
jgi:hypothetical protein